MVMKVEECSPETALFHRTLEVLNRLYRNVGFVFIHNETRAFMMASSAFVNDSYGGNKTSEHSFFDVIFLKFQSNK